MWGGVCVAILCVACVAQEYMCEQSPEIVMCEQSPEILLAEGIQIANSHLENVLVDENNWRDSISLFLSDWFPYAIPINLTNTSNLKSPLITF